MPVVSKVNKDLQEERDKVIFNVEEFTNWYHGGADKVKEKRFFGKIRKFSQKIFLSNEILLQKVNSSMTLNWDMMLT